MIIYEDDPLRKRYCSSVKLGWMDGWCFVASQLGSAIGYTEKAG